MHTLTNWRAKRAGGRITVYGTEQDGRAGKIVGVDEIKLDGHHVVAVDRYGRRHELEV